MIGLTGGIASGKSSVAQRLKLLGAVVLDTDLFSREAVEPLSAGWQQVKEAFPQVIQEDLSINRRLLGEIVFADGEKRKRLEGIIHPIVLERMLKEGQEAEAAGKVVFAEVPLLFEVGWDRFMDQVWVVYVDPRTQLERLIRRSGLALEEAQRIINSQLPLADKVRRADRVIDNTGSLEETWDQVDLLWRELQRENSIDCP